MKVTVEDISTVKKKLHIQVPPDAIALEMKKALADMAKKAKIPGFRPGKAPKNVVEKHYHAEIQSDVMNRVISDSYLRALNENSLIAIDMPNITNISPLEKDAPLNFTHSNWSAKSWPVRTSRTFHCSQSDPDADKP